jgi:hypothetical protein
MSNPTETEILAMEFEAALSVQRRVGFSTLYRLARRESLATIAGPWQSEHALEGACRLLNVVLAAKEKCSSTSLEKPTAATQKGRTFRTPLSPQDIQRNSARQHNWGKARPCRDRDPERCFHFTPALFVSKA